MTFTVQLKDCARYVEHDSDLAGSLRQDRGPDGQVRQYQHNGFVWVEFE